MTRAQMSYKATLDPQDYEMIEFMLKRFKLWTGITKPKPAFRRVKFEGLPSLPSRGTTSSYSSRSLSNLSSDSSGSETTRLELNSSQYMEYLVGRVIPQWQSVLTCLSQVEKLDKEEEQQMQKLERAMSAWKSRQNKTTDSANIKNKRHSQPSSSTTVITGKPPLDPTSRLLRFRSNLQAGSAGTVHTRPSGRMSITPPGNMFSTNTSQKDALQRPFSDQSPRHVPQPGRPASDSQQHRVKPVHPPKPVGGDTKKTAW